MKRPSPKRAILVLLAIVVLIAAIVYGPRACFFLRYGPGPHSLNTSMLDVDRGFVFPAGFPADPGETGKKTIEGIDSDHDGVRDDVQRWIYALFPKDPDKQMALRQMAGFYQEGLDPEFGPEFRKGHLERMNRAIQCEFEVFKDEINGYYEFEHLKAKMLNTYARTVRYLENDWKVKTEEMSDIIHDVERSCERR